MIVEVKISGIVSTQRYGTLETNDILRTDPEYARFLVEECQAGTYVTSAAEAAQKEQPAAAPKRTAKKKEKPQ